MADLSLNDLFLVGLALDIFGATLLAKGLLMAPDMIYRASATYVGWNSTAAWDRCKNRVSAEFGLAYLGLGFIFQAAGYGLEIGGVHKDTGSGRLLAAIVMALVAVAAAMSAWLLLHERRTKHVAAKVTKAHELADAESARQIASERAARGEGE